MTYFEFYAERGQLQRQGSDVVEWDPTVGFDVIEERLPREVCERRLLEEAHS